MTDRYIRPEHWDAVARVVEDSLHKSLGLGPDLRVEYVEHDEHHVITVRDLKLVRDRMFTRLALSEPLDELRVRLHREEWCE